MASQMFGVTGNRRLRRNQRAELNARLQQLPSILAAEQAAEQQRKDEEFKKKQLAQEKKIAMDELKFKREESKRGFGMEMAKLGTNIGFSDMLQGRTLGTIGKDIKGLFGGGTAKESQVSFQPPGTKGRAMTTSGAIKGTSGSKGFFANMPIGSIAAGGLAGFGMGKMFGDMGKGKKLLYGGLAGAGLGLLSGGLSGALGGGLGGMFGGMIG